MYKNHSKKLVPAPCLSLFRQYQQAKAAKEEINYSSLQAEGMLAGACGEDESRFLELRARQNRVDELHMKVTNCIKNNRR